MVATAFAYWKLRFQASSEWVVTLPISIPLALATAFFFARWGVKRGWYLRPALLWSWTFAATTVLVTTVLGYQAAVRDHERSQNSVVLSNVRLLAAAADQYFLENGKTYVALRELVGPTAYIKALNVGDVEAYPAYFTQGVTITVRGVADARTVTYAP